MRIALIHYHLKPGGVTRVISHAVEALQARGDQVVVLTGEAPQDSLPCPVQVIPPLGYTMPNEKIDAGALAFELRRCARAIFSSEPDVWHIHNHALGKNTAVAEAAGKLAMERPVVLQIHDFAEDGRPANYALLRSQLSDMARLYPSAPQIHYAVLNHRDHSILSQAGLPDSQLHLLPNAISLPSHNSEPATLPSELQGHRLVLYPTRGIRRKNMGEFLLHAALAADDTRLATTLKPANPTALPIYERWVQLSQEKNIPAHWGLGEQNLPFTGLINAAQAVITTSIAEGFGLAFLEPILFGKPLCGRDLPEITADFRQNKLQLNPLYTSLPVPLPWIGEAPLRHALQQGLTATYQAYQHPLPPDAIDQAMQAACPQPGIVDFGHLDETLQESVILRIIEDPARARELPRLALPTLDPGRQEANLSLIRQHYSLSAYGERLHHLYEAATRSPVANIGSLPHEKILHSFLTPARFRLLRT